MSLYTEWQNLAQNGTLVSQVQGDCGVYSFWYATLLLRQLDPTNRPVVYPRRMDATGPGESVRHFAKRNVGSGQGELLTANEVVTVIRHFGYTATVYNPSGLASRKKFITKSLKADRPVLFAYIMGKVGPVTSATAAGTAEVDYGPHWSLIIDETTNSYRYIEPNNPTTIVKWDKDQVLASNAKVNDVTFARYWGKPAGGGLKRLGGITGAYAAVLKGEVTKVYDIGTRDRQKLNKVLIAVS